jgi:hypothetical protein
MAEITADILTPRSGPALSTTSDMPTFDAPASDTVLAPPAPPVSASTADVNALADPDAPPAPEPAEPLISADPVEPAPDADAEPAAEPTVVEPTASEPTQRHGRPTLQERINDLTAARRAAEALVESEKARAELAERLVEEMLGRVPKPQDAAPPTLPPTPPPVLDPEPTTPRPQRENFDAPDTYDEALLAWAAERSAWRIKRDIQVSQAEQEQHQRAEREATERATQQQTIAQREQEIENTYQARVNTIVELHPDFNEVVGAADLPISFPVAAAIKQSEDGPAVAYHLGKNPELARKIAAMVVPGQVFPQGHPLAGQPVPDAQRQLIELGKVFAAVAAPPAPAVAEAVTSPPAPIPPPPAPITPLRRGNQAAVARSIEEIGNADDGMEEYARIRTEQLQDERRRTGLPSRAN